MLDVGILAFSCSNSLERLALDELSADKTEFPSMVPKEDNQILSISEVNHEAIVELPLFVDEVKSGPLGTSSESDLNSRRDIFLSFSRAIISE
mmetsp:Transcript_24593/g.55549  ORF Transcript_24593/g.55549 Transcript_24593/m.55549 type:complete len:93 (+) Transcript_24593:740-1018(+)